MFTFIEDITTKESLEGMDFPYFGAPLNCVPADDNILLESMDYAYFGSPVNIWSRGEF